MFSPSANPTCATVRWKPSSESSCTATFSNRSASEIAAHTWPSSVGVSDVSFSVVETASSRSSASRFACARAAFLCGLHGERRVLADGDEDVDLVAARAAARERLVDGEDAEQLAVRSAHRHEQRVVRMPRGRVVGDDEVRRVGRAADGVPVDLAGRDEVRAALQEARVEQRLPLRRRLHLAEQRAFASSLP